MDRLISGVQQIGIGVRDAEEAARHYRDIFGMEALVFDDVAEAKLMTAYTNGKIEARRAILTLNMKGGGGFEIWQYKNRTPQAADFDIMAGDLGYFAARLKTDDAQRAYSFFQKEYPQLLCSELLEEDGPDANFWVKDRYGNRFNIVSAAVFFKKTKHPIGGVVGAAIGVANMDQALNLYQNVLGLGQILSDRCGIWPELGPGELRRVVLQCHTKGFGAFSPLFGNISIELIQSLHRKPAKIFGGRQWGDLGFIHLCYDVIDMDALLQQAVAHHYRFAVDSKDSFSMDSAAGRFCYIESDEGTLIELVETHKVPLIKKLGWYLNLNKRGKQKPLPKWMLGFLGLRKVK